jgi:hypothetical protein
MTVDGDGDVPRRSLYPLAPATACHIRVTVVSPDDADTVVAPGTAGWGVALRDADAAALKSASLYV